MPKQKPKNKDIALTAVTRYHLIDIFHLDFASWQYLRNTVQPNYSGSVVEC